MFFFIIENWNAIVGSQEIPGVTGKCGLEIQSEAGRRLRYFVMRTHWLQQTHSSKNRTDNSTHECPQMIKTKVKLIVFVAAENGESSLQSEKQNLELTVPQNMNCILQNSGLN